MSESQEPITAILHGSQHGVQALVEPGEGLGEVIRTESGDIRADNHRLGGAPEGGFERRSHAGAEILSRLPMQADSILPYILLPERLIQIGSDPEFQRTEIGRGASGQGAFEQMAIDPGRALDPQGGDEAGLHLARLGGLGEDQDSRLGELHVRYQAASRRGSTPRAWARRNDHIKIGRAHV